MVRNETYDVARQIVNHALSKKAGNVVLMDLRDISPVTDFFIICEGDSDVQVKAISEAILEGARNDDLRPWHKEGFDYLRWVLLDYVDIVVHVFQKDVREFYGLERFWGDAKIEYFQESAG